MKPINRATSATVLDAFTFPIIQLCFSILLQLIRKHFQTAECCFHLIGSLPCCSPRSPQLASPGGLYGCWAWDGRKSTQRIHTMTAELIRLCLLLPPSVSCSEDPAVKKKTPKNREVFGEVSCWLSSSIYPPPPFYLFHRGSLHCISLRRGA